MALALLANTAPRIVSILNANPSVWSGLVSGNVGSFPSDAEIAAATLEADGDLIVRAYFNSVNRTLAQPFMAPSSPLANGSKIAAHRGNAGKVEVSKTVLSFTTGGVNTGTDVITPGVHGLSTGDPISFIGSVPGGLVADTTYYAIFETTSSIKVASSRSNAAAGTAIDLTSSGSGTMFLIGWQLGVEADDIATIANAVAHAATYVGTGASNYLYKVEDGVLHHSSTFGRIEIPTFSRTTALQANREDEPVIIGLAVKLLTKNASPAPFKEWTDIGEAGVAAIIRDGSFQMNQG